MCWPIFFSRPVSIFSFSCLSKLIVSRTHTRTYYVHHIHEEGRRMIGPASPSSNRTMPVVFWKWGRKENLAGFFVFKTMNNTYILTKYRSRVINGRCPTFRCTYLSEICSKNEFKIKNASFHRVKV